MYLFGTFIFFGKGVVRLGPCFNMIIGSDSLLPSSFRGFYSQFFRRLSLHLSFSSPVFRARKFSWPWHASESRRSHTWVIWSTSSIYNCQSCTGTNFQGLLNKTLVFMPFVLFRVEFIVVECVQSGFFMNSVPMVVGMSMVSIPLSEKTVEWSL